MTLEIIRQLVRHGIRVRVGIPTGLPYAQTSWFPVDETARTLGTVAELVEYSFEDPASIRRLFDGITRVLLHNTIHEETVAQAKMFIDAAKDEPSVNFIARWSLFMENIESNTWVSGIQREIGQLLKESGIRHCQFGVGHWLKGVSLMINPETQQFLVQDGFDPNALISLGTVDMIAEVLSRALENPRAIGSHELLLVGPREPVTVLELLELIRERDYPNIQFHVATKYLLL